MGWDEAYKGEFQQIQELAWKALDAVQYARSCCRAIHVSSVFCGKLAAGFERFRRWVATERLKELQKNMSRPARVQSRKSRKALTF